MVPRCRHAAIIECWQKGPIFTGGGQSNPPDNMWRTAIHTGEISHHPIQFVLQIIVRHCPNDTQFPAFSRCSGISTIHLAQLVSDCLELDRLPGLHCNASWFSSSKLQSWPWRWRQSSTKQKQNHLERFPPLLNISWAPITVINLLLWSGVKIGSFYCGGAI